MATPPHELLSATFPPEILEVIRTLKGAGFQAFLVGGSVRDLLLGKAAKDYDVATSARAEKVLKLFKRVVPTGIKHGTVTVLMKDARKQDHGVEVTTFRGEGEYLDGRRPSEVIFLDDIVADLARRDFTMNAMAYDPVARSFEDPFGGKDDLSSGLVRCVGEARARFGEDGLRAMRAVRFAAVLDFRIHEGTLAAIPETRATFAKVAQERIRDELLKLLLGGHPGLGLTLLRGTELLPIVLPELAPLDQDAFARVVARLDAVSRGEDLRLAAMLLDTDGSPGRASELSEGALTRLRLPRKTLDTVALLVREQGFSSASYPDDASLRRALARTGADQAPALLELGRADAVARKDVAGERQVAALKARVEALLATHPPLTAGELALDGRRIMAILGKGPGPQVGRAMRHLLEQVVDDPSRNTTEALEGLLKAWANHPGSG